VAQLVVRGIDDDLMEAFKERARRRGRSVEQEVRLLIERAAAEDLAMERFVRKSERMLRALRERGGSYGDTAREIRRDRSR
jgi:plasmid stability protein